MCWFSKVVDGGSKTNFESCSGTPLPGALTFAQMPDDKELNQMSE